MRSDLRAPVQISWYSTITYLNNWTLITFYLTQFFMDKREPSLILKLICIKKCSYAIWSDNIHDPFPHSHIPWNYRNTPSGKGIWNVINSKLKKLSFCKSKGLQIEDRVRIFWGLIYMNQKYSEIHQEFRAKLEQCEALVWSSFKWLFQLQQAEFLIDLYYLFCFVHLWCPFSIFWGCLNKLAARGPLIK